MRTRKIASKAIVMLISSVMAIPAFAGWKELWRWYGRSWNIWMEWKIWMEWIEFRAKIQLFSDTAKFEGVIRKCLKCAFRLKVVKLPYS